MHPDYPTQTSVVTWPSHIHMHDHCTYDVTLINKILNTYIYVYNEDILIYIYIQISKKEKLMCMQMEI